MLYHLVGHKVDAHKAPDISDGPAVRSFAAFCKAYNLEEPTFFEEQWHVNEFVLPIGDYLWFYLWATFPSPPDVMDARSFESLYVLDDAPADPTA